MTKILLIVLLCLSYQAYSGLILTEVNFADEPTPNPETSEPTNQPSNVDPTDEQVGNSENEITTTGNEQTPIATNDPIQNEGPIVILPYQTQVVSDESVEVQSTSSDSSQEKYTNSPTRRRRRHNHHLGCRAAGQKELSLLAQQRIHLVDFRKFRQMQTVKRIISLQEEGSYDLRFTALTPAPIYYQSIEYLTLKVKINDQVHKVQLGYNQVQLGFQFEGRKGKNSLELTLNADDSRVPSQTFLSNFQLSRI